MKLISILSCLSFICLLGGCASAPSGNADEVEESIARSFERMSYSMERLAYIESATRAGEYTASNFTYDQEKLPQIWRQEITLVDDFHGDIEKLVNTLSVVAGLEQPRVVSPRQGRPVIVAVSRGKRELISFLADAANQAGSSATVIPSIPLSLVVIKYEQSTSQ